MQIARLLSRQRADPLGKPRDFPRGGILVQHAFLSGAHQLGLRGAERGFGSSFFTALDRLFDLAREGAHTGAAVAVYGRAALDLADRFFG